MFRTAGPPQRVRLLGTPDHTLGIPDIRTRDLSLGSFATAQDTVDPIAPVQDLGHHPNAR